MSHASRPALYLVPLVLVGAALSACGSPASGISVVSFQKITAAAGSCSPGTEISANALLTGGSDGVAYFQALQVQNDLRQLVDQSSQSLPPLRSDQHAVVLDSVTTTFKFVPDASSSPVTLKSETNTISGTIQAGGSSKSVIAKLMGTDNGALLAGASGVLNVTVVVNAHTQDGSSLKTAPTTFPVNVVAASPCPSGQSVDFSSTCTVSQPDGISCL